MNQKDIVDRLGADRLRSIADTVQLSIRKIWSDENVHRQLVLTYCDRCPGPSRHKLKQYCVPCILTREALCSVCYARQLEQDLVEEAIRELRPPLDVEDFARI